ncbi:hypothetical protein BDF20DRAFT_832395 [Mycotypha africana]|uniref:uncharacterized protein n=1 Tax=Mycotypha africana TaxID=64632 RepID=UPI0023013001|nr:uncharacterized protein BDF20DRAFT_832395 [Mycotypha africana]KAI8987461.1 hypothetical protein BDF20DRAFT_832395 [Mycotypha africana]
MLLGCYWIIDYQRNRPRIRYRFIKYWSSTILHLFRPYSATACFSTAFVRYELLGAVVATFFNKLVHMQDNGYSKQLEATEARFSNFTRFHKMNDVCTIRVKCFGLLLLMQIFERLIRILNSFLIKTVLNSASSVHLVNNVFWSDLKAENAILHVLPYRIPLREAPKAANTMTLIGNRLNNFSLSKGVAFKLQFIKGEPVVIALFLHRFVSSIQALLSKSIFSLLTEGLERSIERPTLL